MGCEIIKKCEELGIKLTEQRRIIARVIADSEDHPDVEKICERANKLDPNIGLATVYRAIKLFEENNIISKLEIGDGKSRYEIQGQDDHHHHLIDITSGEIIEFEDEELEELKEKIAKRLGYKLVDHKLELWGIPLGSDK
jgi:Fur family ferric uptake transcriptional regulator